MLVPLLTRFFLRSGVRAPQEVIELLQRRDSPLVIVALSSSIIIEAFLRALTASAGREAPVLLSEAVTTPSRGSTLGPQLFFTSLHQLDSVAITALPTARFVTLNLFHVRGPVRANPSYRLGLRGELGILLGGALLFVELGAPLSVEPARSSVEKLKRLLKLDFYRHLKLIRGTPLQSQETQRRIVLSGAEFERELSIIAQRSGMQVAEARRLALREFSAIAANPRRLAYGVMAPLVKLWLGRMFSRISATGLHELREAVAHHPVVLVPMHRSHLDYVILGSLFYEARMNPPLVAAGVNLNIFLAGPLIQALGAYFVRRDARRDRIHAIVLKRYVAYLLKRGHLQEFFIEGGRSRSGKMRPPRLGLLSIMLDAFTSGARRDIQFVPVAITYERVVEDRVFGEENTGRGKEKETFVALIKARRILRRRYGEVRVNFGPPVSLRSFLEQSTSHQSHGENRAPVLQLGNVLTSAIRDASEVTLSALTYTALLGAPRYGLTRPVLLRTMQELSSVAKLAAPTRRESLFTPTLTTFLAGASELIDEVLSAGIVERRVVAGADVFYIPGSRRFSADFYRNSVAHLFFITSFAAVLELIDGEVALPRFQLGHGLFGTDLLLGSCETFLARARLVIDEGIRMGIFEQHGPDRVRFVTRPRGVFTPSLVLAGIESQLWAVALLQSLVTETGIRDFDARLITEQLVRDGKVAQYLGLLTRTEATSQSSISAALEALHRRNCIALTDTQGTSGRLRIGGDLKQERDLLAQLQRAILRSEENATLL